MSHDIQYMQRAITLALKAKGDTSPNPIVGAVIVKNNKIIAEGWHRRCGEDHAEIAALKKNKGRASGATLYVTLEPCSYFGRTPPCVNSVIESGIKRVVIGMKDPNPLTNGKSIRQLKAKGIAVEVGVLEEQCQKINEVFIKFIQEQMPFVVAKSAQTLDGKIATATGDSKWITSEASRTFARNIRNEFDAILVGVNTILKDNPGLNPSNSTKRLKKIVLDSTLKTPFNAKIFEKTSPEDCILATTQAAGLKKIKFFLKNGVSVMVCRAQNGRVDLKSFFRDLAKQGITSILLEGGAQVVGSALKYNLVDKMHVYIAPKIVGDQNALSSVQGLRISKIQQAVSLKNITVQKIGEDILVEGYVYRNR